MAEHKHGSMNIEVQEKTFAGFMKWATWIGGISLFLLVFMAVFNG